MPNKLLIAIIGPTACGKTETALKIATHFNTEIISADSRQVYRGLSIGTAAPSVEELATAKHHFIQIINISENYNVSCYEKEALSCLDAIFTRHDKAILTGGSGLYINAVCNGLDELPDVDEQTKLELKQLYVNGGIEALRTLLKKLDHTYYQKVDLANHKRLLRALEVCLTTGKPFSSYHKNEPSPRNFNLLKIGIQRDRNELYDRINKRVDNMIAQGLIEEARKYYPFKHNNALNTVGYKELFDYFDGLTSLDFAIEKIKINSRRYAKRQLTWFRKDNDIAWVQNGNVEKIIELVEKKKE